jgi:hypothetical protein
MIQSNNLGSKWKLRNPLDLLRFKPNKSSPFKFKSGLALISKSDHIYKPKNGLVIKLQPISSISISVASQSSITFGGQK